MVEAAKRCYRDYPTVVNDIEESGLTYTNDLHQYARMDSKMQQAQKAIGGSSDSAQLAQSYYWSKIAKGEDDEEKIDLYNNIIILAVLAQVSIDGCKKVFAVDSNEEIARIREMSCMKKEKDYPLFMKYVREIPVKKSNGTPRDSADIKKDKQKLARRIDKDIICPMNWLQESLNTIQNNAKKHNIPTEKFFIKNSDGIPWDKRHVSKIYTFIDEYDRLLKMNTDGLSENDQFIQVVEATEELIAKISRMHISKSTFNRLVALGLGLEGKTNTDMRKANKANNCLSRLLNIMHKTDKQSFLECFIRND